MKPASGLDPATLEKVLELLPEFVLVMDRAGTILYINRVEQGYQHEAEQLRGLLPICAWCGKIRNERGQWESLDGFVSRELARDVTHSQCGDCATRELAALDPTGRQRR